MQSILSMPSPAHLTISPIRLLKTHLAPWVLGLLCLIAGCGGGKSAALAPPPDKPVKQLSELHYAFGPGAIKIGLIASQDLNKTENVPAALSLCLLQLSDLSAFTANSKTQMELTALLNCDNSLAGTISAMRYLIQPSTSRDLVIDRLEQTKYIAAVGGFSTLPVPNASAFLLIPVHENKKLIFSNTFQIEELNAWLLLGEQNLELFPKLEADLKYSAADFVKQPQVDPKPPAAVEPQGSVLNAPQNTAPPQTPQGTTMRPGQEGTAGAASATQGAKQGAPEAKGTQNIQPNAQSPQLPAAPSGPKLSDLPSTPPLPPSPGRPVPPAASGSTAPNSTGTISPHQPPQPGLNNTM
jgi:hypothetical protein